MMFKFGLTHKNHFSKKTPACLINEHLNFIIIKHISVTLLRKYLGHVFGNTSIAQKNILVICPREYSTFSTARPAGKAEQNCIFLNRAHES
ncbi:hypothetical protein A359_06120 [secondary endosymbiont of Ctenarytaina eucalypti]|uniref:Uncharacterized protein n=1 Tax=secondary endosymbiont of Ctenarytaina eucalypti TaxID=1199245 RepID=J3Z412_9ENTR|nr:hypothetical protein A359_06120 [secondary endosymbiont of Ctenarytaina eucalypti]